jgi:hypothetical protein
MSQSDEAFVLESTAPAGPLKTAASAQSNNAILLEVAGAETTTRMLPLPEDGRPVYVSDLLRQSGLIDDFPRMDAALFRASPSEPAGIRMGIKFRPKSNQIAPEHDYALKPGDRLRVVELQLNPFEEFANAFSIPNGRRAIFGF